MSSTQPIQASAFDEAIIQFNSNSMHRKVSTGSVASSTSGESIVDPTDNEPVLLAQEQAEDVAVPATALAAKDAQVSRARRACRAKADFIGNP